MYIRERDFDKVNGVRTRTLKKQRKKRGYARCVWQFIFTIFRVLLSPLSTDDDDDDYDNDNTPSGRLYILKRLKPTVACVCVSVLGVRIKACAHLT